MNLVRSTWLGTAMMLVTALAWAESAPVYTGLLSNTGAGGYDVVSYFDEGNAVPGSADFTVAYLGATWRFHTADHREQFQASPERYAPAYGGYCAWAVSQGYLAKGDPEYWTIIDGRLFLNYSRSVQEKWLKDTGGFIRQADQNWPGILQ